MINTPSVNPVRADGWEGNPEYQSSGPSDTPFVRDSRVHAMMADWRTMAAVTNGSDFIKAQHNKYLPIEPREDNEVTDKTGLTAYMGRVNRSVLSPYCLRLIENAAGLVLRRPIQIDGDQYWKELSTNVDGLGSSINEYARRALVSSITYGHSAILVDFPSDPEIKTLRDELQLGRRPYFINIDAPDIWGWRQESTLPSSQLTQVRIHEWVCTPEGDFGEERKEQMRVIYPGRYETWDTEGATSQGKYTLERIPLIPIYSNRLGMLTSKPPLIDIASLNITHYQRQADLINALHIAAMPILVLEGWDEDATPVGVNYGLSTIPGNKIYYVGTDSSSFAAQQEEISKLEHQMSSLGITKLLGQKFVAESADAKRIDQQQANSVLSIISMELESALQQAYDVAAEYTNKKPPKVTLDRDFDFYRLLGQDVSVLDTLNDKGKITDKTLLEILKAGEILPDTIDINKELQETATLKNRRRNELLDAKQQSGSVVPPTASTSPGTGSSRPRNPTQTPRKA